MRKYILTTIVSAVFLFSCKYENKNVAQGFGINLKKDAILKTNISTIKIKDSLIIGTSQISDSIFIKSIEDGLYLEKYEVILHKINKNFINWAYNKNNYILSIDNNLTLELKRKKFLKVNKDKDIQIMLYTKVNNIAKDSILFYKYQWDKDLPNEQRLENLSYLDEKLNLWHLETYSNQSEAVLTIGRWEKLKINQKTGKINLIKKMITSDYWENEFPEKR